MCKKEIEFGFLLLQEQVKQRSVDGEDGTEENETKKQKVCDVQFVADCQCSVIFVDL